MASGSNSRGLVLLLITSCFFITGLLFDYMPMIIDDHIKRTIELATNEEIIGFWSKPPIEVNSYYWLYDISNAEQFQKAGEKPLLRKVGPFHFTSRIEKRLIELSANKFRLTYNSTRYLTLNESQSRQLLDEPLQLLNPILGSIIEGVRVNGQQLDGQSRAVAMGSVNRLFERYNESIVARMTPRVALLGRPMPIVDKLRKIAETFGMGERLPEMAPPGSKIGYVALANGTWSGPFEIYTGYQETAQSLGDLISYKGKRRLDYYEGKCNRLQVSAGELQPMPIDPEQKLEIFAPNFCRVVHLQPTSQVKLREGQAIKYVVAPEDLLSAQSNPDNRCFCTNTTDFDDHCSLNGVVEMAPCSFNAPMLLTLSNMQLDPKITSTIGDFDSDMLRGDVEHIANADEQAQFVILKRVGVPIKADLTITLMMKIIRDPKFKQTVNVPEVSYVPLVTVREAVSIPPNLAQILINLESFLSLTYHIKVVMYLTAIVLLCWLTGHYYCRTSAQMNAERRVATGSTENGPDEDPNDPISARHSRRSNAADTNPSGDYEMGVNSSPGRQQRISIGSPLQQQQQQQQAAGPIVDQEAGLGGGPASELPAGPAAGRFRRGTGPQLRTVEEAIRQAARSNDPTSGERANSADSSRSLPPSRQISRLNSLEGGNSSFNDQPTGQGDNSARGEPVRSQPTGLARVFSKVDEELRARDKLPLGDTGDSRKPLTDAQLIDDGAQLAGELPPPASERPRKRRRKGWFMNVYTRLVGMLSGIRSTIEDVGQLDVRESDSQDKRLEMLAGKIDNWYSISPFGASETGGSSSNEPASGVAAAAGSSDEQSAASAERDSDQPSGPGTASAGDIMQARQPPNDECSFKTKRLVTRSLASEATEADTNNGEPAAASFSDIKMASNDVAGTNQRSLPASGGQISSMQQQQAGHEGQRGLSAYRNNARAQEQQQELPAASVAKPASTNESAVSEANRRLEQDGGGGGGTQMTASPPASIADVERDKTSKQKREASQDCDHDDAAGPTPPSEAAAASKQNNAAPRSTTNNGADLGSDDEAVESEEEAARRKQDQADKAATLKRIEDALKASDKSQPRADLADSTSGEMTSGQLDGRQAASQQQQRPRVAMINSSTSIDSVINSTALNGDDVSASSFDSYVTQVATSGAADGRRTNDNAAPGSAPNQSAGDETTLAAAAREQIDESSGARLASLQRAQQQRQQSNKWPATGPSADVISPAGGLSGGSSDLLAQSNGRDSPTSRQPDLSSAAGPMLKDNGRSQAADELDARNGISGTGADLISKQAASSTSGSSLTEFVNTKAAPPPSASVNGSKSEGPSGDLSEGELPDQVASNNNNKNGRPTRTYALGPAAQVNGIVASGGQPINVGATPTITKSLIGGPQAAPNLLLANGGSRQASRGQQRANSPVSTQLATFQAGRDANAAADGNNILNEKIISHQQQWPRHKKRTGAGQRSAHGATGTNVAALPNQATLASNSNQRSANQTTGNHHHQRVQPAGF